MAEYIKRATAMTICEKYGEHCFEQNDAHGQNIADGILEDIVALNPEDVVPVVRCSQCRKRYTTECALWYATLNDQEYFVERGEDFYCSYGEKK